MPPRHAETNLDEERQEEIKHMLEKRGYDIMGVSVRDMEWIDQALSTGKWHLPSVKDSQAQQDADPPSRQRKRLVTYVTHAAREYLGQPVGAHHEE
jgi:hypothetical protein